MNKNYFGIIPPLVTPLKSNGKLDVESLERLIEHVVGGGVHGLFILGTTGEAQSLSFELRKEMIKESVRILKNRIPLLVGITDSSEEDSAKLGNIAYEYGADALVSAPPFYFATGQPELVYFYERLVEKLQLPLFLYNMPTHTKVNFSVDSIVRLAQNKKIIGFKDSSAHGAYLQSVIHAMQHRKDFSVFVGPEEMTAETVLMGGAGGVNGGANLFPKLYVDLYNAAKAVDMEKVHELQALVMQISATIYTVGQYSSSYLKGLKCAMSVQGLCENVPVSPFYAFEGDDKRKIEEALRALNLDY